MSDAVVIRSCTPPPVGEHFNPVRVVRTVWANRELIRNFAQRDMAERHKGALLGVAWNILNPLLTLAVYTVVFGMIFHQRWGRGSPALPDMLDFPLTFFAGNAVFAIFAECVNKAPTLVSSRPNLVRRVVFPLEILPVAAVRAAIVHAMIIVALLLIVLAAVSKGAGLHWQIVFLPLVLLPLALLSVGFTWTLAAVGVFVRDVRHIVVVLTQLLMFMTPLFYQVDRIPPDMGALRAMIQYNPLSVVVENARRVLLWGEMPDWLALGWVTGLGVAVAMGGFAVFSALRRSMADVH
jgi:lipopolysaccharide transport system permease protein